MAEDPGNDDGRQSQSTASINVPRNAVKRDYSRTARNPLKIQFQFSFKMTWAARPFPSISSALIQADRKFNHLLNRSFRLQPSCERRFLPLNKKCRFG